MAFTERKGKHGTGRTREMPLDRAPAGLLVFVLLLALLFHMIFFCAKEGRSIDTKSKGLEAGRRRMESLDDGSRERIRRIIAFCCFEC